MIRGDRVTLRPWRKSDLEAVRRWHDDGEIKRFWNETMPLVVEGYLERGFESGGRVTKFDENGEFIICDETMRPIGQLGYHDYSYRHRHAELSILIGEKDALSEGYGSDAIVAFGNWFFNQWGAHRLWLTVQADNPRAQRAYKKVGFTREGTWRDHVFIDGRWVDEYLYGLLRHEYNARYRPDLAEATL